MCYLRSFFCAGYWGYTSISKEIEDFWFFFFGFSYYFTSPIPVHRLFGENSDMSIWRPSTLPWEVSIGHDPVSYITWYFHPFALSATTFIKKSIPIPICWMTTPESLWFWSSYGKCSVAFEFHTVTRIEKFVVWKWFEEEMGGEESHNYFIFHFL